ncbi:hypothetical protein CAPTEDRAFT_113983 [Capitella teleta]|uniref:Sialin n=1 Tax=Capitella teleta TaxID=283909 RepID=R7UX60_CAPTE|nr:hypothetical protein CAPTEDRAFT_113983 [Capitella teleta]|eukprot:ELU10872.1 hypothetical protein CAPTEDRAFT_113983 [Capitella teleta]
MSPISPLFSVPWLLSCRVALALVGFLGFVNLYALRVNLSVGLVCMVNQTAIQEMSDSSPAFDLTNGSNAERNWDHCADGEFAWPKATQGMILGAFFWGYLLTQIPGGWLAERFGGKAVFGWFMLMTAVATLLTPIGARTSPWFLVALRIIQGLGEGVVFPAMHALWSKWAPPLERSKLIGFTYAGSAQIGNVLTMPISGLLCDYGFDGGWGSIFYIFGTLGVVWFILWMFIAYNEPSVHPRISDVERDYIEQSIGGSRKESKHLSTPWRKFFTSKAIWGIIIGHMCANWGTYTLLTNIPTYMKEVLRFDIKSNGLFSAIPYVAFWLFINVGGVMADYMRSTGWETARVRKIMYCLGTLLPAAFLIGVGYISCATPYVAIVLLTLGVGFSGFQYPGVMVNHVDVAPPFAGTLFGISNTLATLPGILAPYAIGVITKDQTEEQWQIVFYISAAIYTVGAIFFVLFACGEIQPWVREFMFDDKDLKEMTCNLNESDDKPAIVILPVKGDETSCL